MTGNKIAWRAPLAGLASLAMVATMGVTALSAEADPVSEPPAGTFEVKYVNNAGETKSFKSKVTGVTGESLVDAIEGENLTVPADAKSDGVFVGWYEDGSLANYYTARKGDVVLTPKFMDRADTVEVKFEENSATAAQYYGFLPNDVNSGGQTAVFLPKGASLTEASLPFDKADQRIPDKWTVEGDADVNSVDKLTDVTWSRPDTDSATIRVKVAHAASAVTTSFEGSEDNHAVNSYADGGKDAKYAVDAAKGSEQTAPAITVKESGKSYSAFKAWTTGIAPATSSVDAGKTYKAAEAEYKLDNSAKDTFYFVVFDSMGGSKVAGQYVKENGYVDASKIDTPKKDKATFAGWASDKDTTKAADFDTTKIASEDKVFYAKWDVDEKVTELKVTFKDDEYNGKHEDVSVKVKSDAYLTAEQIPDWTRDGYILDYWTATPNELANKDTEITNAELMGDYTAGQFNNLDNFTLTAHYTKVTVDLAKAALKYVDADDEANFTPASWAKYWPVYKKAAADYQKALDATVGDTIPADKSAAIVSDLKAGWEQLQFKAATDESIISGKGSVHRLYNPRTDEHFYTADSEELSILTSTGSTRGGWNDEGRLFAGVANSAWYASFDGAVNEAGYDEVDAKQAGALLAKVATPISKAAVRMYNVVSGDHVWTTNVEEIADLENQPSWKKEGAAFYVPTYNSLQDVVRLYRPVKNRHLLSTDPAEQSKLAGSGWNLEGVAFKAY